MIKSQSTTVVEYIWIGGKNEIRSKSRVFNSFLPFDITAISDWNYDGSSTWQADSNVDTEIILKPCALFKDPFRVIGDTICYLVLCDTYKSNGEPTETNRRHKANILFDALTEEKPWFGLEQEYFFTSYQCDNKNTFLNKISEGYHYCGIAQNINQRIIVEKHLQMCIEAGIQISGINAEVVNDQWEFQIGPCEGIQAGDHLIIARYILERLAQQIECYINYNPKIKSDENGSGCHINFSTFSSRCENGIEFINKYIERLEKKHEEHISVYGENNHLRLSGIHETSSINKFSWGIGTRNTSIRIPNQTFKNKCGYFEDRRPASNIDPYLATSTLFKSCCLNEDF